MDIPLVLGEMFAELEKQPEYGWLGERTNGGEANYDNLDWRDTKIAKPTLEQIETAWPAAEKKYFTDVDQAKTDKATLVSELRTGTVSSATLQNIIADILEGK